MWQVFTSYKAFDSGLVGNLWANRLGLHLLRMGATSLLLGLRRIQTSGFKRNSDMKLLVKDGIVMIENFLPADEFARLQQAAAEQMAKADAMNPVRDYNESGFGRKHDFEWGFDRCDGGTLNRFYQIHENDDALATFVENPRLKELIEFAAGCRYKARKVWLYRMVHGDEDHNADDQRVIHRDTFHSAIKFWYSLSDVTLEHGPFHYRKGSHKLTFRRLKWEYNKSLQACREQLSGSFRASESEVVEQYGGAPVAFTVPANTLVLADIRGWHCRGLATSGVERVAIYGNFRPNPFQLMPK